MTGINGLAVLANLTSIDFPRSFPPDSMHLFSENVIPDMCKHYRGAFFKPQAPEAAATGENQRENEQRDVAEGENENEQRDVAEDENEQRDAELVTVLAARADDYAYIPLLWASLVALVAYLGVLLYQTRHSRRPRTRDTVVQAPWLSSVLLMIGGLLSWYSPGIWCWALQWMWPLTWACRSASSA